jgi:5-methylthioadenosine/S-adenosylhomocysteine deaminase
MSILIRGGFLLPGANSPHPEGRGDILIDAEGAIAAIGALPPETSATTVIDAVGCAVIPALVNAHTHLCQTFMRGLGDDRPLLPWLREVIWPMQAAMTPDDVYLSAMLGLAENLICGVGRLTNHFKLANSPAHSDALVQALIDLPVPVTLAYGWNDLGQGAPSGEHILAEMKRLHARLAGSHVTLAVGPMAAWRCSDETMRQAYALAKAWGVPFHIHIAETQDEVALMIERNGMRHVEWLANLGVLGPLTQIVHGVWLSEAELDHIAEAGATVIHCPTSNMYLASGTAKVPTMLRRGVPVWLGTDGDGSNNSQDVLELMKIAALLAKLDSMDATAILPRQVLGMATANGAIRLGAPAALTLVDIQTPRAAPVSHPVSALVYNVVGPDAKAVIIGNHILMQNGHIPGIDLPVLLAKCQKATADLMRRAGLT